MFITDTDKRIDLNCKRKNSTKLSLKKKKTFQLPFFKSIFFFSRKYCLLLILFEDSYELIHLLHF